MIHITAGTDTYGRVKSVAGTPIVTKFAMLQFLPVFPIRSYYFAGTGEVERRGILFVASEQSTEIVGYPLASVDKLSVAMAYARGVFAALAIVGFLAIVPGIMVLTGDHLDEFAMILTRGLLIAFGTGVAGGLATYAIPQTSRREREVRLACGELLGLAADPARFDARWRKAVRDWLDRPPDAGEAPRGRLIRRLISARLEIADSGDAHGIELECDDLLEQLGRTPTAGATP